MVAENIMAARRWQPEDGAHMKPEPEWHPGYHVTAARLFPGPTKERRQSNANDFVLPVADDEMTHNEQRWLHKRTASRARSDALRHRKQGM